MRYVGTSLSHAKYLKGGEFDVLRGSGKCELKAVFIAA